MKYNSGREKFQGKKVDYFILNERDEEDIKMRWRASRLRLKLKSIKKDEKVRKKI